MKGTKAELELKKKTIQAEIDRLEEIEWQKNESPLYDRAIGKYYGVNCLNNRGNQQYLIYFKHLARIDDREFDCIAIDIRSSEGKVFHEQINREIKFYHHASMIGDVYPEISQAEFMKVYEQVKRRLLI